MPDAIDLDAAISGLEDSATIYHGVGKSYWQRFNGKAPAVADRISAQQFREMVRPSIARAPKEVGMHRSGPRLCLDYQTVSLGSWRWQIAKVDAIRRKDDYDGAQLDQGNDFGARLFANQSWEHQTTNLRVGRSNRSGRATISGSP